MFRVRLYNDLAKSRNKAEDQRELQCSCNSCSERVQSFMALCKLHTDRTIITRTIVISVSNNKGR